MRPNVLLIVSDDHGYGDFTRYGHDERVRTPNLDRLASEGISCTDAYVTAPICSPSRAAIVSGTYQQRWGALWFHSSAYPDHLSSLAERFADLGYATGYFGKVHYGQDRPGHRACPPNHGFVESLYGLAGMQQGRLSYLRHSRAAVAEYGDEAAWRMAVLPLWDQHSEVEYEGFLTAELGRRGRDFIDRRTTEPFFCMLAFNAVHNFCWQLPPAELASRGLPAYRDWDGVAEPYPDWYQQAIWPDLPNGREYYLAQLELMDAEVGNLLDHLDRRGIADETIVVYLTDNGGSTCNFGRNTPLRGGKYTLWEGGVRVPFLVRWPGGGIAGGRAVSQMVSALDLYPSLLSAVGAEPETWAHCDGMDQLPAWRGQRVATGHEALHWECGFQWAVRDGDWKLLHVASGSAADHLREQEHAPIVAGTWLINLVDDLAEEHDRSTDEPAVAQRLAERHRAWRQAVSPP